MTVSQQINNMLVGYKFCTKTVKKYLYMSFPATFLKTGDFPKSKLD